MIFSAWNYPGFIWLIRPETSLLINSWVNQSRYCVILSSFIGPVTTTTAAVIDNSAVRKRPLFFLCYWIFLFGRRLPSSSFFFCYFHNFCRWLPNSCVSFQGIAPDNSSPFFLIRHGRRKKKLVPSSESDQKITSDRFHRPFFSAANI